MNTKLKDVLLYSFAAIGVCSLLIAASGSPQLATSTVPESHVWQMQDGAGQTAYIYNKKTGEVRMYVNDIKDDFWIPKFKAKN